MEFLHSVKFLLYVGNPVGDPLEIHSGLYKVYKMTYNIFTDICIVWNFHRTMAAV